MRRKPRNRAPRMIDLAAAQKQYKAEILVQSGETAALNRDEQIAALFFKSAAGLRS